MPQTRAGVSVDKAAKSSQFFLGGKPDPDPEALLQELHRTGFRVTRWAKEMMRSEKFRICGEPIEAELVEITASHFGWHKGATYGMLCTAGKRMALDLCPARLGPLLRLRYVDQAPGEQLRIAMEPIPIAGRDLIFKLEKNGNSRWLNWEAGSRDTPVCSHHRFAFLIQSK